MDAAGRVWAPDRKAGVGECVLWVLRFGFGLRAGAARRSGGHVRRLDIRITFGTPVSKTYRRRECEGCPFQGRICMKSDSRLHFLALQLHSITRFDACRVAREHVNSLVF